MRRLKNSWLRSLALCAVLAASIAGCTSGADDDVTAADRLLTTLERSNEQLDKVAATGAVLTAADQRAIIDDIRRATHAYRDELAVADEDYFAAEGDVIARVSSEFVRVGSRLGLSFEGFEEETEEAAEEEACDCEDSGECPSPTPSPEPSPSPDPEPSPSPSPEPTPEPSPEPSPSPDPSADAGVGGDTEYKALCELACDGLFLGCNAACIKKCILNPSKLKKCLAACAAGLAVCYGGCTNLGDPYDL